MTAFRAISAFIICALLASSTMAAEPVSHWDFDGNLNDSAGFSKDNLSTQHGTARYVTEKELPGVEGKAVALGVEKTDAPFLKADRSADIHLGPAYTLRRYPPGTAWF